MGRPRERLPRPLYNRRFVAIARRRLRLGEAGWRNHGRRVTTYFILQWAPYRMLLRGLRL